MQTPIPTVTLNDAAKILVVSRKTVNRLVASGKLRAAKVGGRYRTSLEWINGVVESVEPAFDAARKVRVDRDRNVKAKQKATDEDKSAEAVKRLCSRFRLKPSSKAVHGSRVRQGC